MSVAVRVTPRAGRVHSETVATISRTKNQRRARCGCRWTRVRQLVSLEDGFEGVDELLDVTLTERDCEYAVGAVKHAKQVPDWTTQPTHELIAFGVSCAVQRAGYRLERTKTASASALALDMS